MVAAQKDGPRTDFEVEIVEDDGDWPAISDVEAGAERAAEAVAQEVLGTGTGSFLVVLSSDANVALLNHRFRGKDKPTNVLSFPPGAGAPEGYLGDIVLAQATVAREAEEQGVPFVHHVQHLIVHGILHLLGYDHETPADAERMEELEIRILSRLGVANPYTGELETGRNGDRAPTHGHD